VRIKKECFIYHASLTLLVVSMFACENTHRVALGLVVDSGLCYEIDAFCYCEDTSCIWL